MVAGRCYLAVLCHCCGSLGRVLLPATGRGGHCGRPTAGQLPAAESQQQRQGRKKYSFQPVLGEQVTDRTKQKQARHYPEYPFLDALFTVKVSGKDTGGRCVIFDTLRMGTAGPVLHFHKECEEWFQVLEGEFKFQAGKETLRLQAGDTLLVPRGMEHAFVKISLGHARLLVMHQPAGRMEEFFRTASQLTDQRVEARPTLAAEHDIYFTGSTLQPD